MLSVLEACSAVKVYSFKCADPHERTIAKARSSRPPSQRVIRIFRLGRYTDGGSLLRETLRASSAAVGLMAFFMAVLTLLLASIVYFAEMGKYKVTLVSPPSLPPFPLPCLQLWAEWFVRICHVAGYLYRH